MVQLIGQKALIVRPDISDSPVMSLQMTLVFAVLVTQMVVLTVLVLPSPYVVRKNLVKVYNMLKSNSNVKVGVIFVSVLMLLQFFDCWNRLKKFHHHTKGLHEMTPEHLATKFYSQRNLYISGAVLYLGLAIGTVMTIIDKLVLKLTHIRELKEKLASGKEEDKTEKEKYERLIELKKQDLATLNKQLAGLQRSYDDLNVKTKKVGEKKNE